MMAVSLAVSDASSGRNWLHGALRYVGRALIGLAALGAAAVGEGSVYGQMPQQTKRQDFPQRELVIGTKEAPPFAMKDADGNWSGISIELWREVAQKLGLRRT
ncbi:transporter substrate-binding domain-containing protein [Rhizobium sp. T1470]|uniref:transporter substrate-binding domain-containing protein n=1 Tax=Rhizobium sp. T1473 TaxID=555321 RepID=UPI0030D097AD